MKHISKLPSRGAGSGQRQGRADDGLQESVGRHIQEQVATGETGKRMLREWIA